LKASRTISLTLYQSQMADIFISYSKGFAAQTEQLVQELQAKGFSVWYDTSLVPGDSFRDVIMSELAQARAAIVIWDAASVKSEWVCSEASRARARGILVPVRAGGGAFPRHSSAVRWLTHGVVVEPRRD
jgi:hypothetical protein